MALTIKSGKTAAKSVPMPGKAPSWVLGSRPPGLRQQPIQRIKPQQGVTDYGKIAANPSGVSAGDTGKTPWS